MKPNVLIGFLQLFLCLNALGPGYADIVRWDTGELIPGTEGITPEPGVQLTDFQLEFANLAMLDLSQAAFRRSNLADADFSDSILIGANFSGNIPPPNDRTNLSNANFARADLTDGRFNNVHLWQADFSDAVIRGAKFDFDTEVTLEQIYSTESYQAKQMQGVSFGASDLSGADFRGQDFSDARFRDTERGSNLVNADFSNANLTRVDFGDGLFYSNLQGAELSWADLASARLSGVPLGGANFTGARLAGRIEIRVGLQNTNLKSANLSEIPVDDVDFDELTTYNQWTVFPDRFDPVAAGLTFMETSLGDIDTNEMLDTNDIDMLSAKIRGSLTQTWLQELMFDLDSSGTVDSADHSYMVTSLLNTWFGDADLNGKFDNSDLIQVLASGAYETGIESSWSTGDFDGSGTTTTSDFVLALADGGYKQGPRAVVAAVPEPATFAWILTGLIAAIGVSRTRQKPF